MTVLVIRKPNMGSERPEGANLDHESTMVFVQAYLQGQKFTVVDTVDREIEGVDLVITVGGDGTLLHASHFIGPDIPVLAINSAPDYSEGYFCGASRRSPEKLKEVLKNWKDLPRKSVARMNVQIGSMLLTQRGLNDALFCHSNPATTSRYDLQTDDRGPESQMSSGLWVSTAVGSTAAMRSAGGFTSPHNSPNIQYLVREPFQPAGKRLQLVHGFIEPHETVQITSRIDGCRVFVDGTHINESVNQHETVRVLRSGQDLTLLNFRNS